MGIAGQLPKNLQCNVLRKMLLHIAYAATYRRAVLMLRVGNIVELCQQRKQQGILLQRRCRHSRLICLKQCLKTGLQLAVCSQIGRYIIQDQIVGKGVGCAKIKKYRNAPVVGSAA